MSARSLQPHPARTVVAMATWARVLVWLGLPVAGAGLGWALPHVAEWLVGVPWAPLRGPARMITELPRVPATLGAAALGALAGLVLAYLIERDELRVEVGPDQATLRREDTRTAVPRGETSAVFLDAGRLVLLGRDTGELAGEQCDLSAAALADAFARYGWPWRADGDPYRDRFRRWVPEHPDLPAAAHALFTARQRALERGDAEDAADLRAELARFAIVVRDEKKRQYWRPTGAEPAEPR